MMASNEKGSRTTAAGSQRKELNAPSILAPKKNGQSLRRSCRVCMKAGRDAFVDAVAHGRRGADDDLGCVFFC
jgi:hypothetical protein